ncbi:MAG: hypothetical protein KDD67_16100 [Ignavibacteriae bacterium]|nr:hypothetical protein [Ignavibacteriota bacterium]MCB9216012.1 hypothetical protein [Ignavibacteria bacterium]
MSLTIVPVKAASERKQFITMVWDLYRDDPNWVPPLIADRKKLLDPERNPFWSHAEIEMFLAKRDGKIVGRIAAIVNWAHNQVHNDKVGFFGFFESENKVSTAHALFAAAAEWLADRDIEVMRGPVNPSINDEAGLLVDGFDDPPQILMTYNPEYYATLIESYGFTKVKDLYAWKLTPDFLSPKLERVQKAVRERENVTIRTFRFSPKSAFQQDIEILRDIYNTAWEPNWGAVKMNRDEFNALAADLKPVAAKDIVLIAESSNRPVGFALALPDINQALIQNRSGGMVGALWHLLTGKKRIKRGRIIVLGVVPPFQRRGIDAALYYEIGQRMVVDHKYTEAEASWVLEDNEMMNRAARMMKGEIYKTYRLYDKTIKEN